MGRFTKVSKADPSGAGRYYLEGHHEVEIVVIKAFESSNDEGLVFVVEATCLASTNSQMLVGSDYSMVLKPEKHKSAPANMAAFMEQLIPLIADGDEYPKDPDEREKLLEYVTNEKDNPAKGTRMSVEAWMTKTRSGGDFTMLRWGPPKKNLLEDLKKEIA